MASAARSRSARSDHALRWRSVIAGRPNAIVRRGLLGRLLLGELAIASGCTNGGIGTIQVRQSKRYVWNALGLTETRFVGLVSKYIKLVCFVYYYYLLLPTTTTYYYYLLPLDRRRPPR